MFSAMEKVCVGSLVAEGRTAIIPRFMFWAGQKRFSQWERLRDHQQESRIVAADSVVVKSDLLKVG